MKKALALVLVLTLAMDLAGCGGAAQKNSGGSVKTVSDVLSDAAETQPSTGFNFVYDNSDSADISYPELDFNADCDLTVLGSTMVYSEVSNMMAAPEEYLGKTVKASGTFDVFTDPKTKRLYFACIIKDATACCSNGLEFVLDGDFSYPEDYPEVGAPITIGGEFETYTEGEATYCRLKNAEMSV